MKKFAVLSMLVCVFVMSGCAAGSNFRAGGANVGYEVQAHEWRGWSHETTGDWREWRSTTTAGFVTGSVNGGIDNGKEVGFGAYLNWGEKEE